MLSYDEFDSFCLTDYAIEEKIINVIDLEGRQVVIESLAQLMSYDKCTIKAQCMEKYNQEIFDYCKNLAVTYDHHGPVTCHVFRSFEKSLSFPLHTDPDDVILVMLEGEKTIELDGKLVALSKGEQLRIPANFPHRAINDKESLMLSFGLEKFMSDKAYELDVLPQNDGDMQS